MSRGKASGRQFLPKCAPSGHEQDDTSNCQTYYCEAKGGHEKGASQVAQARSPGFLLPPLARTLPSLMSRSAICQFDLQSFTIRALLMLCLKASPKPACHEHQQRYYQRYRCLSCVPITLIVEQML